MRRTASRRLAEKLACAVDWDLLYATLLTRRLLPLLGRRITELAGGAVPQRFAQVTEEAISQTRRQGALLQLVSVDLMQALDRAGIPSLTLKGAFLAQAIYGDPGRRPAGDIDLLVAAGHLQAAVEVVRAVGYAAPTDDAGTDGLPLLHYALRHELGQLPPLELHWRVHWYERTFARDMLDRAIEDPHGARRPGPLDELVSLLLFYARDGFLNLRLATDLGAWWDIFGSGLQPGAFEDVLDRYPALARALLAAATVAERLVGVPTAQLLGSSRRLDTRARLATHLADPNPSANAAQLSADASLVDWLLTPQGGQRAFARRQLLAHGGMLHKRPRASCEQRGMLSIGHGTRVLCRYGLRVMRLARDSTRSRFERIPTTSFH